MYKSPDIPMPRVEVVFPERLTELWLKALARPETDLKCKAADAIALARRRGMKELETTIAPLRAALDQADQHPTVRLAVARTLIALEARETAPSLWQQAQSGSRELRDLVEPALARWDYRPARSIWLERLRDPATARQNLMLAIQALGTVHEDKAAEGILALVRSNREGAVRLEAARALGSLRGDGLEKDAENVAADASPHAVLFRAAAAVLLQQHRSEQAIRLLRRLADDPEPAVVAPAVARLLALDPELLVPMVERLVANSDANVRSVGVEVLFREPSEKHLHLLAERLDDVHPDVRRKARTSLKELAAKPEWRATVLADGMRQLATQRWRALEQATILLAQLDHKPAAERLVELLSFDRAEVFITAAWGLRQLAVAETLPAIVSHVAAELKRVKHAENQFTPFFFQRDHQLSQLNQLLGRMKCEAGETTLRQYIPRIEGPKRPVLWPESRAAAIWALGMIREGRAPVTLALDVEARLTDTNRLPPEDDRVRLMATIALGRLKAQDALPTLRVYRGNPADPPSDIIQCAVAWSIHEITGEAMLAPKVTRRVERDWFLFPRE
jgi:HEAT repeat protein